MGVDVGAAATAEGRKRDPALSCKFDGERRRCGDGEDDLDAAHGRLLNHFVGGSGADDKRAVTPAPAGTKTEQLVKRDMPADVFGAARKASVGTNPDGGVGAARDAAEALDTLQIAEGVGIGRHREGLLVRHDPLFAHGLSKTFDAADAATCAPEHGAAAGLEVVEGFGADGDPHLAARAAGFNHLDVVDVRDGLDDAFGEAEAGAELRERPS